MFHVNTIKISSFLLKKIETLQNLNFRSNIDSREIFHAQFKKSLQAQNLFRMITIVLYINFVQNLGTLFLCKQMAAMKNEKFDTRFSKVSREISNKV